MSATTEYTLRRSVPYHKLDPIWKYRLDGDVVFAPPPGKRIVLPKGVESVEIEDSCGVLASVKSDSVAAFVGYCWNGPNGVPDRPVFMEPSIPHDILCQLISEGRIPAINQPLADLMFKICLKENGGGAMLSFVSGRAVRRYQKISRGV